ncbi:lasso RiPP family leader peptide-containing protein [Rathayibacter iranicus]|nr:lasso RiPP family leader peptide-containing protein [Rathayibacter iranicus NCPPB 2253 = VKM Ac-1602]
MKKIYTAPALERMGTFREMTNGYP